MATPVSILFARYRTKYAFDFGAYRPRVEANLITDRARQDALYAGAGLGATGLALRGVPNGVVERVGAHVLKAAPLAALGALGAGVAMDKSTADLEPWQVAAGTGLATAGTGLMLRGLEKTLSSIVRPGAGNLLLRTSPLTALTAGAVALARKQRDDYGGFF